MTTIELSYREELLGLISDCHKDAYGMRPDLSRYARMSEDQLREELDFLSERVGQVIDEERRYQESNLADIENRIEQLIKIGAGSRAVAIQWLADANNCDGDLSFLEYKLAVPYGSLGGSIA